LRIIADIAVIGLVWGDRSMARDRVIGMISGFLVIGCTYSLLAWHDLAAAMATEKSLSQADPFFLNTSCMQRYNGRYLSCASALVQSAS